MYFLQNVRLLFSLKNLCDYENLNLPTWHIPEEETYNSRSRLI